MRMIAALVLLALAGCASNDTSDAADAPDAVTASDALELGNFSVSLAVQDLDASREFYETLGFAPIGGDGNVYLILQNGTATIGLFHGLFEDNILTFNPGWDRGSNAITPFDDVRDIQRTLREAGLEPTVPADPESTGPASFVITDPDGNMILVDQHVPKPD